MKELFKQLDQVVMEHKGNINEAEFFRLISQYQLSRIDRIETVNNKQQQMALARTSMYDTELLKLFKRSTAKKQETLLFKLVNLLCIANNSLECVHRASDDDKEVFEIILGYSDKLINNKDWYLRVIPESKWLINHILMERTSL